MRQPRKFREHSIFCGLVVLALFGVARRIDSQTNAARAESAPYSLSVSVDEVSLTFHAADAHGLPVNDLKLDELSILDNDKSPGRVLAFGSLRDFPIRAGILMDTSESMEGYLARNRAISVEYAQRLLRQKADQAFVMDFSVASQVVQPWTGNAAALSGGIRGFVPNTGVHVRGTAILDAVYRACLSQFGRIDAARSSNFILLFSDGEDNASHASLEDATALCQRSNTAIYVFRAEPEASSFSTGATTLAEMAAKSGGRVFHDDDSDAGIYDDLRIIEADLRNQYRLVYKPAELRHDGSFHRIELKAPERVESIVVRAGYYAPAR
jgi:Ca-activated chloride channel family protein